MKLAALERLLHERGRTRVFLVTDTFCCCGTASRLLRAGDEVSIEIGGAVRWVFAPGDLVDAAAWSGTVPVTPSTSLTRRLATHRRHLAGRAVPAAYWSRAARA
jgi:hypothetical protein